MAARRFTELRVWQEAHQVRLAIYRITQSFPREERYDLVSQMRRAAVSPGTSQRDSVDGRRKIARDISRCPSRLPKKWPIT